LFYGISKQGGYLNRADEILREIVLPEKNKITIENFIYEHRDIILDFMSKEKEKGIEELYNYLIKNKDKISEEEYNELKKDFENSLFEAYKEGGIPDEFFREYYEKIRNLKVKKEKVKEEKIEEKEIVRWRKEVKSPNNFLEKVIPIIAIGIIIVVALYFALPPGEKKETSTTLPVQFEITDLRVSSENPQIGDQITIFVDVMNKGDSSGSYTVIVKIGDKTKTKDIEIDGKSSKTVEFYHSVAKEGPIEIKAGDLIKTINVASLKQWVPVGRLYEPYVSYSLSEFPCSYDKTINIKPFKIESEKFRIVLKEYSIRSDFETDKKCESWSISITVINEDTGFQVGYASLTHYVVPYVDEGTVIESETLKEPIVINDGPAFYSMIIDLHNIFSYQIVVEEYR